MSFNSGALLGSVGRVSGGWSAVDFLRIGGFQKVLEALHAAEKEKKKRERVSLTHTLPVGCGCSCKVGARTAGVRQHQAWEVMAGSAAGSGPGELPVGMCFYSFLFDDQHLLREYVKAGKLPAPSSLLLGMAMGVVLTGARLALDMIVFKVRRRRRVTLSPLPRFSRGQPCEPDFPALCWRAHRHCSAGGFRQ